MSDMKQILQKINHSDGDNDNCDIVNDANEQKTRNKAMKIVHTLHNESDVADINHEH